MLEPLLGVPDMVFPQDLSGSGALSLGLATGCDQSKSSPSSAGVFRSVSTLDSSAGAGGLTFLEKNVNRTGAKRRT
ncbi:hypothetical protein Q8A67_023346 [Cirrhinus molitorella]|uniref:Uncharacterized protein n=1 Tax=Cirrhinus molitorella TaxID=172907 RepID=A0AA88TKU1_9TELE|nr:hypothetical protein Q8A67_023346 [Cirrhinus molitorella]